MEKYRQFADGGTGVNPFTPLWSHHRSSLLVRLLKFPILLPVALIRLLLFTAALLWLALVELICALIFIGVLRFQIYRLLSSIGCLAALLCLGVLPIGDVLADFRRLKIAPPKTKPTKVFSASRGTLVLANQQSLIDVLFLGLKLSPSFVFVASDGSPVQHGLLGALWRTAASSLPEPPAKPQTLSEIADAARSSWHGPVIVFPEGANTTGGCILQWKAKTFEGVSTLEKPVGVALVSITYSKTGAYTPHYTVGTAARHLFWLAYQPWHTVSSQWLAPSEATMAIKGKAVGDQWSLLRTVLTRMITGAVEVEVPAERHTEFKAFWDAAQRKGYTRQQQQQSVATKKRA